MPHFILHQPQRRVEDVGHRRADSEWRPKGKAAYSGHCGGLRLRRKARLAAELDEMMQNDGTQ